MKIFIKIGTNCLISNNKIKVSVIKNILSQISFLKKEGHKVILVSSGAVGCARVIKEICQSERINGVAKNSAASIGQSALMGLYAKYGQKLGLHAAQFLFTKKDFKDKASSKHIASILSHIMDEQDALAIINENDAIAIPGDKFRDNDELMFYLASAMKPDKVFFLTSVDGVYKNSKFTKSNLIPVIHASTKKQESITYASSTSLGTGGMESKIDSCKKLAKVGVCCHICNAKKKDVILDIINNKDAYCIGTVIKK